MRIKDKVIWITGASSGIGEALAYALSESGNTLILSSRNEAELLRVKKACNPLSKVMVLPMDLGDSGMMEELVARAIEMSGPIDMLINNAGVSQRSLIADTTLEVYRELMEVNYLGTLALTKALLPHFIAQGGGHFITVTSLMGRFGSPLRSGYCAAKHALHGFFDVLRMEHEKDGIKVTLICPGFVRTRVAYNALTGDGSSQGLNDTATAEGMSPDVFARKMIKAIEKQKFEAYIGGKEVSGVYLKRFFPRLLLRVVLRSRVV
ncbi:Short-chain dehydrogenase [Muriicola jejuensis]|uniref:SDR family oxidoreductase n=1 Tax=Muriicola jejuensis TaxID=504488 RepID=A0A6P0UF96_9FLAO|nr:SDR family oxidoreductase [Muriicola jejuensis]NER11130.1 SDR family oxidoreductase [Muriicola jejuensis]SMP23961.1 Short-chain dehydrogenase [Muriicola jejuensis]